MQSSLLVVCACAVLLPSRFYFLTLQTGQSAGNNGQGAGGSEMGRGVGSNGQGAGSKGMGQNVDGNGRSADVGGNGKTQGLIANQIPLRHEQELIQPDGPDLNRGGSNVTNTEKPGRNASTSQQAGGNDASSGAGSNCQGAGGNGTGQDADGNDQSVGAGGDGMGQGAGSNGQGAGSNGTGQDADGNDQSVGAGGDGMSQRAGNNGQGAGGNGTGQDADSNGQSAGVDGSGMGQGAGSNGQSADAGSDGGKGDEGGADDGGVPEEFKAAFKSHNSFRKQHGAEPLKWSKECAEYAQKQADECSKKGALGHGNTKGPSGQHGQNAAQGQADMEAVVKSWYSEEKDYDYGNGQSKGGVTGHFTQLVWKGTKEIGMAMTKDKYYVANYLPAGNGGDEKENVGAKNQK